MRTSHFEASEDIMTKFTSQALHVIRIKYLKAGGSDNPSFLIPALWIILGILLHEQATRTKHFDVKCIYFLTYIDGILLLFLIHTALHRWVWQFVLPNFEGNDTKLTRFWLKIIILKGKLLYFVSCQKVPKSNLQSQKVSEYL